MTLSGKSIAKIEIKSDSQLFLKLWKEQQHQLPSLTPDFYQNCQSHGDVVGTVGCLLSWNYLLDGKEGVAKTMITGEDENSVTYNILEGDLLELYKTFVANVRVETQGSHNLVVWTVEYEKLNADVPDPDAVMDFYKKITKEIEIHHLEK